MRKISCDEGRRKSKTKWKLPRANGERKVSFKMSFCNVCLLKYSKDLNFRAARYTGTKRRSFKYLLILSEFFDNKFSMPFESKFLSDFFIERQERCGEVLEQTLTDLRRRIVLNRCKSFQIKWK